MSRVANRHRYSDTPKTLVKHSHRKNLRRQDRREVVDSLTDTLVETPVPAPALLETPEYVRVPFVLLAWDSGLDWNLDGTSYQDDAPGDFPHSYHLTREDAEREQAWLEHCGSDPHDLRVASGFWVPFWDAHRIPGR